MTMEVDTVTVCDDCLHVVGTGSASQYDECEMCFGTSLVEESLYFCTCGMFESLVPFDVCPECGESAE